MPASLVTLVCVTHGWLVTWLVGNRSEISLVRRDVLADGWAGAAAHTYERTGMGLCSGMCCVYVYMQSTCESRGGDMVAGEGHGEG